MKPTKEEQANAMEFLQGFVKRGDKVYTILRHVSRSGMSRRISTIIIKAVKPGEIAEKWMGEPCDITPAVARVLELSFNYNQEGMRIDGCGMDMGFEIVYQLGRMLFPDGFGEPCLHCGTRPQNKTQAMAMRLPGTSVGTCARNDNGHEFRGRNCDPAGWDRDGGYALSHHWL